MGDPILTKDLAKVGRVHPAYPNKFIESQNNATKIGQNCFFFLSRILSNEHEDM